MPTIQPPALPTTVVVVAAPSSRAGRRWSARRWSAKRWSAARSSRRARWSGSWSGPRSAASWPWLERPWSGARPRSGRMASSSGAAFVSSATRRSRPGASAGTSSSVAAGSEPAGSTSTCGAGYSSPGAVPIHASSSPFSHRWMAGKASSVPTASGHEELDGERALLIRREQPARPLEHGVAGAVGRGRGRPPLDRVGPGVGHRGLDADADRRRLPAAVLGGERHRGLLAGRHRDRARLGVPGRDRGRDRQADGGDGCADDAPCGACSSVHPVVPSRHRGSRRSRREQPAMLLRADPSRPLERRAQRVRAPVADLAGDAADRRPGLEQQVSGQVQAPTGQERHRRLADELGEPAGQGGARGADPRGQGGDRPRVGGVVLHEPQGRTHDGVAAGPEPTRRTAVGAAEPCPQGGDQQQVEEAVEDSRLPRLVDRHLPIEDVDQRGSRGGSRKAGSSAGATPSPPGRRQPQVRRSSTPGLVCRKRAVSRRPWRPTPSARQSRWCAASPHGKAHRRVQLTPTTTPARRMRPTAQCSASASTVGGPRCPPSSGCARWAGSYRGSRQRDGRPGRSTPARPPYES